MFYYKAFGLNITSTFIFPELLATSYSFEGDVHIELGSTPKKLSEATKLKENLWVSPIEYLYHIENVASFYAECGKRICVCPHPASDMKDVRIYLLCNAMAAIVHQRNYIPIHASAILCSSGVVLLVGESGAGKSTSLAALQNRGHTIFTDDVCVVKKLDDRVVAIPSYPMIKLWQNSFSLLHMNHQAATHRIWTDENKFGVLFHNQFITEWHAVWKIFVLSKHTGTNLVTAKKQTPLESFQEIAKNTYRSEYIDSMALNALHFETITSLVKQCEVIKISRNTDHNTLEEVVSYIENVSNGL